VREDSLAQVRRAFAEKIAKQQKVGDPRLIEAFASVPREDFLGPGPWQVLNNTPHYVATSGEDPALVYINAPIALDAARRINNGEPALHIGMLASLDPRPGDHVVHIGVGGGYFTAIIAHLVGPAGRVTAIEYDVALAERATANLAGKPNVTVICADGTSHDFEPADGIYVNAGATRPIPLWLEKLKPSGRLIMVLTAQNRWGQILKVRRASAGYAAMLLGPCGIIPCVNGREPISEAAFAAALAGGGMKDVKSLRRDAHDADHTCWMHCDEFCLSRRALH
jgi:protein-L-isoaspartate(D-aspartate) O-methyltransferase